MAHCNGTWFRLHVLSNNIWRTNKRRGVWSYQKAETSDTVYFPEPNPGKTVWIIWNARCEMSDPLIMRGQRLYHGILTWETNSSLYYSENRSNSSLAKCYAGRSSRKIISIEIANISNIIPTCFKLIPINKNKNCLISWQ